MKPIKRIVACIIASMCLIAMFGCEPAQKPADADIITNAENTDRETDLKRAEAKERPVLMPGKTPKPRKVQYVILPCQKDPDDYEEESGLQFFEYGELDALAAEAVKRSLNTEDVTDLIPLYSYENVLNLNFISDEDKMKGKYEHISYITVDTTWPYVYNHGYRKLVKSFLWCMPDAAIKYDAASKTGYMMYDLDNGMRLYYMLKDMGESYIIKTPETQYLELNVLGNPAVMAKRTSFAEFDGVLKDGATITELAKVDPAFNAYSDYMRKGMFYRQYGTMFKDEEGNVYEDSYKRFIDDEKEMDRPVSSVLILTDGVLKIFWDYVGDDYVVDRYEFREDFIIESYGIEVNYKIDDRYYVG